MNCSKFKTLLTVVFTMCLGMNMANAQDLIARQAPIDKKLKTIDSLILQKQIDVEREEYPALSLYPEWSNQYVHSYRSVPVPETYEIDMSGFCMPTDSRKITSKYGYRWRKMHNGLDIKVYVGDTIRAAFDGKVRIVKYERSGYGRYVVIRHYNGLETVYGHLSKQLVLEDDNVKAGDVIGLGGNTGRSTGSHLHFETRFLGIAINPALMFDFENQDVVSDKYVFKRRSSRNTSTASNGGSGAYYRVRKGDTLSGIAASRRVSVKSICQLNGIKTTSILRPGQQLRLY